jgi:hypothetical protein
MNLNKLPILHLAGSGSGTRRSFKKAATQVPALSSSVRREIPENPPTCAKFLRARVCTTWGGRMSQCDTAGARSSLFTEGVPISEKLAGLAHQKRNLSGGSNPWG